MYALIKKQLPELLVIQNQFNFEVAEDWAYKDFPWYRSTLVLCAEAIKAGGNIDKIQVYLVEIFSELLSENMEACVKKGTPIGNSPAHLEFLAGSYSRSFQGNTLDMFDRRLDEFMGTCATGHIPVHKFWGLCACVDLQWPELRELYLAKFSKKEGVAHAA